jgi:hypothetical protein
MMDLQTNLQVFNEIKQKTEQIYILSLLKTQVRLRQLGKVSLLQSNFFIH